MSAGRPFVELAIEHAHLALEEGYAPPEGTEDDQVVLLGDLLGEMDAARRRGVRVVLLSVDCLGGPSGAGLALFHALRSFSAAGGATVAFVSGYAGSSAADFILGADYVVADPGATIWPHGPLITRERAAGDEARVEGLNRATRAILSTRTLAPDRDVERWIAGETTLDEPGGEALGAAQALELGYVDAVGGRDQARAVAESFARGERVSSPRQEGLRRRGGRAEHREALRELQVGAARVLLHLLMKGAVRGMRPRREV